MGVKWEKSEYILMIKFSKVIGDSDYLEKCTRNCYLIVILRVLSVVNTLVEAMCNFASQEEMRLLGKDFLRVSNMVL